MYAVPFVNPVIVDAVDAESVDVAVDQVVPLFDEIRYLYPVIDEPFDALGDHTHASC